MRLVTTPKVVFILVRVESGQGVLAEQAGLVLLPLAPDGALVRGADGDGGRPGLAAEALPGGLRAG